MIQLHLDIMGQGPPLVMLHGWGWHSGIWQPLLAKLKQTNQLYLIDLPGFGKSPLFTGDYTLEKMASLLLTVAPPKAHWLGWSLGGLVAQWIAIHFPERVTKLISVTSTPKFIRDSEWPGIEISTLEKFSDFLIIDHHKTLQDFLELQLRGSQNKDVLFAELQKIIVATSRSSLPALLGGLKLLRETDLRKVAKKIECPSLYIFGQRDTIVPAALAHLLQSFVPHGQFEIIHRTGHMPFLSQQEAFFALLSQFLR